MVVVLVIARYLGYFLKAKIIFIRLFEREYHMNKIFPQLRYPSHPFMGIGNTDHGFGGMDSYRSKFLVFGYKMIENLHRLR